MTNHWIPFAHLADKYLIEYSLPPVTYELFDVKQYLIVHSVELYLKAAYIKMTNNVDSAIQQNHSIFSLIRKCKSHDPNFLSQYEIREDILDKAREYTASTRGFAQDEIIKFLSREDQMHFISNDFLYSAELTRADLKYWGTPVSTKRNSYSGTVTWTNSYPDLNWIDFIRTIREFLCRDLSMHDYIEEYLNMNNVSLESRRILESLYISQ